MRNQNKSGKFAQNLFQQTYIMLCVYAMPNYSIFIIVYQPIDVSAVHRAPTIMLIECIRISHSDLC